MMSVQQQKVKIWFVPSRKFQTQFQILAEQICKLGLQDM